MLILIVFAFKSSRAVIKTVAGCQINQRLIRRLKYKVKGHGIEVRIFEIYYKEHLYILMAYIYSLYLEQNEFYI